MNTYFLNLNVVEKLSWLENNTLLYDKHLDKVVYAIFNNVNGKVYIGQTRNQFRVRLTSHKQSFLHRPHISPYLYASMKKYTFENFSFYLLMQVKDEIKLDYVEKYFIKYFDSKNPKYGYNLNSGGSSIRSVGSSRKGIKMSEDVKKVLSEKMKGRKLDEERRQEHIKVLIKTRIDPSQIAKRKISYDKSRKRIFCFTNGLTYDGISVAAKELNVPASHISAVVNGKRKSVGGFTFDFI